MPIVTLLLMAATIFILGFIVGYRVAHSYFFERADHYEKGLIDILDMQDRIVKEEAMIDSVEEYSSHQVKVTIRHPDGKKVCTVVRKSPAFRGRNNV